VHWAARIRGGPLALFPKTARAFAKREDVEDARDALLGDEAGRVTGEIERPWCAALYRDSVPPIDAVLAAGRQVYAPVLAACTVAEEKK
jgi:hypothetical protein